MTAQPSDVVELVEGSTVRVDGRTFHIERILSEDAPFALLIARCEEQLPPQVARKPAEPPTAGPFVHIDDDIQPLLWGTSEERRHQFLSTCGDDPPWILRASQQQVIERLHEVTGRSGEDNVRRLVIVGATGAGKTATARRFRDIHNAAANSSTPVVCIRSWSAMQAFYRECLIGIDPDQKRYALKALRRSGMTNPDRRAIVIDTMREAGVRTLVIEHRRGDGLLSNSQIRTKIEALDAFADELGIAVISLERKPLKLPDSWPSRWRRAETLVLEPCQLGDDFQRALAHFERRLPLRRASGLASVDMAGRLYAASGGDLGKAWCHLVHYTDQALEANLECLGHSLIDRVEHDDREELRLAMEGPDY